MNFNVLFTVPRYLVSAGSLILAFSYQSAAIAENTFSGPLPDRGLDLLRSIFFRGKERSHFTRCRASYAAA